MRLAVFSHKPCWPSADSPTGYATDGGFPFQMQALSQLFDATTLAVPCAPPREGAGGRRGGSPLQGHNLSVAPLPPPRASGFARKARMPFWVLRNAPALVNAVRRADAVHAPIPGDVGTIGMLLAFALRKPLFVRHCGNWFVQRTIAEHFWRWWMERVAGGRNIMLATGGAAEPPSRRNPHLRWIFSTSLREQELADCAVEREPPRPSEVRLIIACRQEREKGTAAVLESLPTILRQHPGATLQVVGDGSALTAFRRLAETLGVSDRVRFHGKVEHPTVLRLLQEADVFCYPTAASEGFPKVVLEALACGLPVVTTHVSVLPQLIGRGGGLLLDAVTPEAIAAAVHACVADPARYRALSARAVETAREYSLERWSATIGAALQTTWGPLRADA